MFYEAKCQFSRGHITSLSIAKPLPDPKFLTTNESFQMRYYVRIFLKGHQNSQRTKCRFLTLLNKKWVFLNFLTLPLEVFMPLEENPYIVPHLKAIISDQIFWGGQRCGSTLSLWNAFLKISILLHKIAFQPFWMPVSVYGFSSRGIRMARGQSFSFLTLLNKK